MCHYDGWDHVHKNGLGIGSCRQKCSVHGAEIIWEPGGDDKPTIHGRWYCPKCQEQLMQALDNIEKKRQSSK